MLRVEVCDFDPTPPIIQKPSHDAPGGRGLLLVAAVASAWGSKADVASSSKVVWFDVRTDTSGSSPR